MADNTIVVVTRASGVLPLRAREAEERMRLDGKVAVITGAGSGVGAQAAALFAREGARVVAAGRTLHKVQQVADQVTAAGGACVPVRADVSSPTDVDALFDAAVEHYSGVDILVNNAGIGYSAEPEVSMRDVLGTPEEDWQQVLQVNLTSVYLTAKRAIPMMAERGGGSIVNVASTGGVRGMFDAHAYSAAKGGMVNFTRSMAIRYGAQGIRVNCVAPGGIDTPMIAERLAARGGGPASSGGPARGLGRVAQPIEIAYPILWLASDEASFVTGAVLVADGGATA